MNSTSAVEVIIQALWPGPDVLSALGAPLVTYASRSATRCARSGAAAAGAGVCACAPEAARNTDEQTAAIRRALADRLRVAIASRILSTAREVRPGRVRLKVEACFGRVKCFPSGRAGFFDGETPELQRRNNRCPR